MYKPFNATPILIFMVFLTSAQNTCSTFYPMTEGASYNYEQLNKKGKIEGTSSYTVTEVTSEAGNTQATMKITYMDGKGKNAMESDFSITCTTNGILIDFESLFPTQMRQQYDGMNMDMDLTGTDIELPNNLTVGQELADANITVTMNMGAMNMKMEVNTIDRKVIAKESVTTKAGTFDCFVIGSTTESKVMMSKQSFSDKIWLAPGIGLIKQESYSKNGKLMGSMELESYSK